MRNVVCVTSDPGANLVAVVEALSHLDPETDVAVVATPSVLRAVPSGAARVVVPNDDVEETGFAWFGLEWAVAEDYDQVVCVSATQARAAAPNMLRALIDVDAVVGSRFVQGATAGRWGARLAAKAAQLALRLPVRDSTTSLMGFKRHVLEAVHLADLKGRSASLALELKHRAHRLGFTLAEVPVQCLGETTRPSRRKLLDAASRVLQISLGR